MEASAAPSKGFETWSYPVRRVGLEYWNSQGEVDSGRRAGCYHYRGKKTHTASDRQETPVLEARDNLGNMDGKTTFCQIRREPSRINLHLCSTWVTLVIHGPATEKCMRFLKVFPTANLVPHWKGPKNEHFNYTAAAMYALLSEKLPNFNI